MFFAAGIGGGLANAMAGGGKLIVFPLLLAAGLPPKVANVTGTVGVWPAQAPAAWVYRDRIGGDPRALLREALPGLVGTVFGALALIFVEEAVFVAVVPFLLVVAVTVIVFGKELSAWVRRQGGGPGVAAAVMFATGIYAGFFGAGMSLMIVAALTLAGVADIHDANARKNLYGFALNSASVLWLGFSGLVSWPAAILVALGALLGAMAGRRSPGCCRTGRCGSLSPPWAP